MVLAYGSIKAARSDVRNAGARMARLLAARNKARQLSLVPPERIGMAIRCPRVERILGARLVAVQ